MKRKLLPCLFLGLLTAAVAFAEGTSSDSMTTAPDSGTVGDQSAGTSPKTLPMVRVKDLHRNFQRFAGQEVMISGEIDELHGANAFILDGVGMVNDDILVVVENKAPIAGQSAGTAPVLKEGQEVELTGRAEELNIAKLEERYKLGLDKSQLEDKQAVLIVAPQGIKLKS